MIPPSFDFPYTSRNDYEAFKEHILSLMQDQQEHIQRLTSLIDEHDSIIRNLRS